MPLLSHSHQYHYQNRRRIPGKLYPESAAIREKGLVMYEGQ